MTPLLKRLLDQLAARGLSIQAGAERLTAPESMGRLFKALCLCHPALPIPAGFET